MSPRILVADPDEGFGLMLAQMLEMDREYVADYVSSGFQALKLAREKHPQLVIIDAALVDMTPPALIKALRQTLPDLRIMLIPLTGSLPGEYASLNIHGTLPKPFFVGDLGGCIARALGDVVISAVSVAASPTPVQVNPPAAPKARSVVDDPPTVTAATIVVHPVPVPLPPAPPATFLRVRPPGRPPRNFPGASARSDSSGEPAASSLDAALNALSKEISAEALFVISAGSVVAQRSTMNELRQESMAELMAGWFKIAADMAAFVGERGGRFKQFHFEGDRYHIYGFAIADTSILVAICRSDVPFGNLRLSIRTASPEIARYLH